MVLLGILAIATPSNVAAAPEEETALTSLNNEPVTSEATNTGDVPAWLARTSFSAEAASDSKPKYFMETIQPLLGTQGSDLVFFNQSRISQKEGRPSFNTGLGLRKIFNATYLLGTNIFYDYQELHKHSRGGVGVEYMNDAGLEARANSYIRISNPRLVHEDTFNWYYEKVANGFDWEIGAPLPFIPMVKVYGGGEWYDYGNFKNKYGWKLRAEAKPTKVTRINFETFDDTKRDNVGCKIEGSVSLAFTSFNPKSIIKDIFSASKGPREINLYDKTLDRVVRNFDITVIKSKKNKATGLTIEGGKL
jgi:hypothetical protein